ncbi:unnamed protein product [Heligmosomoides polygyrus]|uniref:Transposase n=1 Tax=Heligmosomoides polygyrus TaxID=6339 RepID=A0A183FUQ8_HELPZ|nr:unnamed protein product [Heligmosomoides polygyrus]
MLRWTVTITRIDRTRNDAERLEFGVAPLADMGGSSPAMIVLRRTREPTRTRRARRVWQVYDGSPPEHCHLREDRAVLDGRPTASTADLHLKIAPPRLKQIERCSAARIKWWRMKQKEAAVISRAGLPTVTTVDGTWKKAIDAIRQAARLELGTTKPGRRRVDKHTLRAVRNRCRYQRSLLARIAQRRFAKRPPTCARLSEQLLADGGHCAVTPCCKPE